MGTTDSELTTVRRYTVRRSYDRGRFYLDGNTLLVHSSYGSYAYYWSHPGDSIRRFLVGCDTSYIASKLCPMSWRPVVDFEASTKRIRERILELRRCSEISREDAREEWNLADFEDEVGMQEWYAETHLADCYEYLATVKYPPYLDGLLEHLWPLFVDKLREELAAEAKAS